MAKQVFKIKKKSRKEKLKSLFFPVASKWKFPHVWMNVMVMAIEWIVYILLYGFCSYGVYKYFWGC
jgi:hypothetical protein